MSELVKAIQLGLEKHSTIALASLVEAEGSVPQKVGAKMLISEEGRFFGTIGGGTIEYLCIKAAKKCLEKNTPKLVHYLLDEDGKVSNKDGVKTNMLCGGEAKIFIDILGIKDQIYIFGAGHIAQKLTPLLKDLGFNITILESRKEYFDKKPAKADKYIFARPEDLKGIDFVKNSYIIMITHSHALDEEYVKVLLKKYNFDNPWKYLGMIGSKQKVKEIFSRLKGEGIDQQLLNSIYAPIGIPLGKTHTPIEIAISIAAQIVKKKNKEDLSSV